MRGPPLEPNQPLEKPNQPLGVSRDYRVGKRFATLAQPDFRLMSFRLDESLAPPIAVLATKGDQVKKDQRSVEAA